MNALILAAIITAPWNIIPYQIEVSRDGNRMAHLEPALSEQVQDTINRYYYAPDPHDYLFLDGDKLEFVITPYQGDAWRMWGCIIDGRLIIASNNPLRCT